MKATYQLGQRRAPVTDTEGPRDCPSVMDYPGRPYICTRNRGHRARHEAVGLDGEWVLAEWDDAGAVVVQTAGKQAAPHA